MADFIPEQTLEQGQHAGPRRGRLGLHLRALRQAVRDCLRSGPRREPHPSAPLWPLPRNLGELLAAFDHILVPEINTGQLVTILRDKLWCRVHQLNKVTGQPFTIHEVEDAISVHAQPRMPARSGNREVHP